MSFAKLLASNRVFSCITVSVDRDRQRQGARRKSLPRPGNPAGGLMKRFRMAALAIAMTLAFSGLALAHDHDADDGYYNRGGSYGYPAGNYGYGYPGGVYGRGGYGGSSYNIGYQDGSNQARRDVAQNKPFNPNPRNGNHSDRGYNRSYGDKYAYQDQYMRGYQTGYQANFRGTRGWAY